MFKIDNNKIIIENTQNFNIDHILECGQVFHYEGLGTDLYRIVSGGHICYVSKNRDNTTIETDNIEYFINYFDLNTDYAQIKQNILAIYNTKFMNSAIKYGSGIRILKQDYLETILSFMLSANNNIQRVSKSIGLLCSKYGKKTVDFKGQSIYLFPDLSKLKSLKIKDLKEVGAGYRAKFLYNFIEKINSKDLSNFVHNDDAALYEKLLNFNGIGPKIADCILLFAYSRSAVFPVDTWIEKFYIQSSSKPIKNIKNEQVRENLTNIFKEWSGYAQQYIFYYKRSKKQ